MADIISFENRLRDSRTRNEGALRRRKIQMARKLIQMARRGGRCEKCHTQISDGGPDAPEADRRRIPYALCESCLGEFVDFIERLQGRGDPDHYWQNDVWIEAWRRWIDYRGTLDRYVRSKEFLRLMGELDTE